MTDQGLGFTRGDATPAVSRGDQLWTRGDLRDGADALRATLSDAGVARLLIHCDDSALILQAITACFEAGLDLYVAHTSLSDEQVEAICQEQGVQRVIKAANDWRDVTLDANNGSTAEGRLFTMTSGTTGMPKIATHSLPTLISKAKAGLNRRPENGGRWLLTYQPTGFAGLQVTLTAALWEGLLVTPLERSMSGFYQAATRWDATHISATPTFWRSFLMLADPEELSLQQITLGGEASDQPTLDRLRAAFPDVRMTHTYASTEAGVVYAVHDGKEGFPAAWLETAPKGVGLRIVDGFLHIKTANMMRGYASKQDQPLLDDGWLATADLAVVEGDRVRVLGRDDNTINVGGSKVYPLPVEAVILDVPGVIEAHVYGVANPVTGQLVAADVVREDGLDPKATKKTILAACRESMEGYSVPRVMKFVDEISVSASTKKG